VRLVVIARTPLTLAGRPSPLKLAGAPLIARVVCSGGDGGVCSVLTNESKGKIHGLKKIILKVKIGRNFDISCIPNVFLVVMVLGSWKSRHQASAFHLIGKSPLESISLYSNFQCGKSQVIVSFSERNKNLGQGAISVQA
jgi:hypothetical protein